MRFSLALLFIFYSNHGFAGYSCSRTNAENNNCADLVKMNADAGLGRCLPLGAPDNIPELFERNNIRISMGHVPNARGFATGLSRMTNLTDPRVVALARVVEAFDQIGGGAMTALKDGNQIDVVFANNQTNNSRRYGSQIQVAGGNQNMTGTLHSSTCGGQDNHALLAHELGHYIAGNNDQRVMTQYQRAMRGHRCRLTSYCSKNIGEEFAEVIAAYVTFPQRFANRGESCNRAFNFMKELFNEPQMTPSCEARRNSYRQNNRLIPPRRFFNGGRDGDVSI